MFDSLSKDIENLFKDKVFLTIEDVAHLLSCDKKVIYNWTRRVDPKKRPPRIAIGKTIRFPRGAFIEWLLSEQESK